MNNNFLIWNKKENQFIVSYYNGNYFTVPNSGKLIYQKT